MKFWANPFEVIRGAKLRHGEFCINSNNRKGDVRRN